MPKSVARQLEWAAGAQRHLIEIEAYIETENPVAARTVVNHILIAVERLAQFPVSTHWQDWQATGDS